MNAEPVVAAYRAAASCEWVQGCALLYVSNRGDSFLAAWDRRLRAMTSCSHLNRNPSRSSHVKGLGLTPVAQELHRLEVFRASFHLRTV